MRHRLPLLLLCAALSLPAAAHAACYADYKAKQDDPLRLHYGVMAVRGPCEAGAARAEAAARLAGAGWTLLEVISVFEEDGLDERKENAGPFFLRF